MRTIKTGVLFFGHNMHGLMKKPENTGKAVTLNWLYNAHQNKMLVMESFIWNAPLVFSKKKVKEMSSIKFEKLKKVLDEYVIPRWEGEVGDYPLR